MKKISKLMAGMLAMAAFALPITSCEEEKKDTTDKVAVGSVKVEPGLFYLEVDSTVTLTATLLPEDDPDNTLTWSSFNDEVATVSVTGARTAVVRGVSIGATAISVATSNNKIAICDITVSKLVPLEAITIEPGDSVIYLERGEIKTLTATQGPANATNYHPVWTSSNPTVATVENGVVKAVGAGSTTVTVTSGSIWSAVKVSVTTALLKDILITSENEIVNALFIAAGDTLHLGVKPEPEAAEIFSTAWISDNEGVATVTENGALVGVATGEAAITVSSGAIRKSIKVFVNKYSPSGWTATARNGNHEWGDAGGGDPLSVFDGDRTTGWHSKLDAPLPQCFIVNMQTSKPIDHIVLWHHPNGVAERWIYYQTIQVYLRDLQVAFDDVINAVNDELWEPAATFSYPGGYDPVTIDLKPGSQGKYLILYFPDSRSGTFISFCELDVYSAK
ncbi:MAG: Ig-like domain-containing protein [Prevotellaceae bacterium]|nr:Ig-like domain-containing protein [Prevotellaceae bacterium]